MLRVQLELDTPAPVIMVTSAGSGDGKTTLVAALAAAFSESDRDVVVMDLDLRRPSLAKVLGVEQDQAPDGDRSGDPLGGLVPVPKLPNVKLLPPPVTDMTSLDELMTRLPLMLAQAQRVAGCVILDSAPVGEVSEALRIANMCETVVFVARPRHTDRRRLVLARDLLARADAHIAGVVLIGSAVPGGNYGAYYGYARREMEGLHPEGAPADAPAGIAGGLRSERGP